MIVLGKDDLGTSHWKVYRHSYTRSLSFDWLTCMTSLTITKPWRHRDKKRRPKRLQLYVYRRELSVSGYRMEACFAIRRVGRSLVFIDSTRIRSSRLPAIPPGHSDAITSHSIQRRGHSGWAQTDASLRGTYTGGQVIAENNLRSTTTTTVTWLFTADRWQLL